MKRFTNKPKKIKTKPKTKTRVSSSKSALNEPDVHYRLIFESAQHGILIIHAKTGEIEDANPYILELLGYSRNEIMGKTAWQLYADSQTAGQYFEKLSEKGTDRWDHLRMVAANGRIVPEEVVCISYQDGRKILIQSNIREITDLKRTEKSLQNLSHAIDASGDAVFMTDKEGIITSVNPKFTELYGYTPEEVIGKVTPRILKSGFQSPEFYTHFWRTILQNELVSGEVVNKTKDGRLVFIEETVNPFLDDHGNVAGFLAIQRNVTERKRAEEKVRRQLSRLKALREIDIAIASGFAMPLNLSVLLKHTIAELGIDAADVLLLNPDLNLLEYAAGHGFRTGVVEDLNWNQPEFVRTELLDQEEFVANFGVPLIAKGLVKGVLETFHRAPLDPDEEWLDFLQTLAGQAAIAIEDAQLFQNLQKSNIELLQAYDATIEGWSRALDLRDKETEGHTRRVTEMAIMLGGKFGMSDKEPQYVRWGGLLHDIGKMAVPDRILLKPDTLTSEETEIMKQHPLFALQMLSAIHYLKPALDIPYCHHERWDGTGYPRGLKGEEIPLAARIFAIADVYDALSSDRPYRSRWAEADVIEYIRQHAASIFDPQIVNVFLQMTEEKTSF